MIDSTSKIHTDSLKQFSATSVSRVLKEIDQPTQEDTQIRWLKAVAARVCFQRPDLAEGLIKLLGVEPGQNNILQGLSIGEVSVCYEALLAGIDTASRKASGQYFTPDDAAQFMAAHSIDFGNGTWLDPCCGVGNLAWHLTSVQDQPEEFIRNHLVLIDQDSTALRSAVALIGADFLGAGDIEGLQRLNQRAEHRDFLSDQELPIHDFVIVNPPYARTARKKKYETGASCESFAYFIERIAKSSRGFISVTPASYLSAPKFWTLREIINQQKTGGEVFVFDNVPDTLFRGYKYGSSNTSKTNFVRAAITICKPQHDKWMITPIIRWRSTSRERMFSQCAKLLSPRKIGPYSEWAKLAPGLDRLWDWLMKAPQTIGDLTVKEESPYSLTVALTPRYYISAAFKTLDRTSKAILYFSSESDRDKAALVLNSSLPYIWWRALDGGVTLPRRVLYSIPVPTMARPEDALISALIDDEKISQVTKLNAGKINENIKRPRELVNLIDQIIMPGHDYDLGLIYSEDMFRADPE